MSDSSTNHDGPLALDFKSATLYAVRVVLHRLPMQDLIDALERRMSDAGSFFENEPVVIDASAIEEPLDWAPLISALRKHSLYPIGVMAQTVNVSSARDQGLTCVDLAHPTPRPTTSPAPDKEVPVVAPPKTPSSGGKAAAAATATPETGIPAIAPAAMVINRPLRSGQRIYARNTDLIVIGIVNRGAEVIADGNIHVYGPLRGKAMAGARGDTSARIFTTHLDPELLAIAGVYRVIETQLEPKLHNQPTIVQLEGEALRIIALGD
ncbi:septum site-determining protein MinC [Paralcaligenes ureilyticus]|uniref:Probable septum site-determining protein MinC n=1 Tax=Paralcaligenes ureilyticus TaxID=627131 RepID=A0A4V6NZE8_9BURK|nr:septum site-determining protein MinC [Paralcaligenes ureilyticus]TCT00478.1 septum site-determining protein MinC [Paralcaligenes ureilyticus]